MGLRTDIIIYVSLSLLSIFLLTSHLYSISKINKINKNLKDNVNKVNENMKENITTEINNLAKIDTKIISDLQEGTKIGSRLNNLDSIIKKDDEDNIILTKPTTIPGLHITAPLTTSVGASPTTSVGASPTTSVGASPTTSVGASPTTSVEEGFTNDYALIVDSAIKTNDLEVSNLTNTYDLQVNNNSILNTVTASDLEVTNLTKNNNLEVSNLTNTNNLQVNNNSILNTVTANSVEINLTNTNNIYVKENTFTDNLSVRGSANTKSLNVIENSTMKNLTVTGDVFFTGRNSNIMSIFPAYMVIAWAAPNYIPQGWALCNGKKYSLDSNGNTIEDNISGFLTPDLRGRFVLGGGVPTGNTTLQDDSGRPLTSRNINGIGGEEKHELSLQELPSHSHKINSTNIGCKGNNCAGEGNWTGIQLTSGSSMTWSAETRPASFPQITGNSGGNLKPNTGTMFDGAAVNNRDPAQYTTTPHENMPPFYVLTYIVKL